MVPPDALAVGRLVVGGADGRLDAVHVIEPVGAPPVLAAAREAVYRLHEAAAVARLQLRAAVERAQDGVRLVDLDRLVAEHLGAAIAADGQLD